MKRRGWNVWPAQGEEEEYPPGDVEDEGGELLHQLQPHPDLSPLWGAGPLQVESLVSLTQ